MSYLFYNYYMIPTIQKSIPHKLAVINCQKALQMHVNQKKKKKKKFFFLGGGGNNGQDLPLGTGPFALGTGPFAGPTGMLAKPLTDQSRKRTQSHAQQSHWITMRER